MRLVQSCFLVSWFVPAGTKVMQADGSNVVRVFSQWSLFPEVGMGQGCRGHWAAADWHCGGGRSLL